MSVIASKRGVPASNLKPVAHGLYKSVATLVLNPDIVPKQLTSEFKHPLLGTVRDMLTHLAIAGACDPIHDYRRRSTHLMAAHDDTIILDDQLELLADCRRLPKELTLEILKTNCSIARGIKSTMCEDRKHFDASLHSNRQQEVIDINAKETAELIKGISNETHKGKTVDGPSYLEIENNTSSSSLKELKRIALEESPELVGIINDPTCPESPTIDKVREVQKMRANAAEAEIRRDRRINSSH